EKTEWNYTPAFVSFALGLVSGIVALGLGVAAASKTDTGQPDETLRNAALATAAFSGLTIGLAITDNTQHLPPKGINDVEVRFSKAGYASRSFTIDSMAPELSGESPQITYDLDAEAPIPPLDNRAALRIMPPSTLKPSAPSPSVPSDAPVIAVLKVRDPSGVIDDKLLSQLTLFLNARVANSGFRTIPRPQIESAIKELQRDSFNPCVDEACQIELGKAVAAEQTLAPSILHIGGQCIAAAGVYDLRTQAGIHAVTVETDCSPTGLMKGFEEVAHGLSPETMRSAGQPAPPDDAEEPEDDMYPSWAIPEGRSP
ncbi:MAG: hypothetical protein AAF449_00565, partial [Myxococcota bacterium]